MSSIESPTEELAGAGILAIVIVLVFLFVSGIKLYEQYENQVLKPEQLAEHLVDHCVYSKIKEKISGGPVRMTGYDFRDRLELPLIKRVDISNSKRACERMEAKQKRLNVFKEQQNVIQKFNF